ncbi:hypothetical protein V6N13_059420 [Hibiscus sabdariffa]
MRSLISCTDALVLGDRVLDKWLENVTGWSPEMGVMHQKVWLSVDMKTLSPSSFERCRFHIETCWITQIDEVFDLYVDGRVFRIRVMKFEEAIGSKCDCCCGVDDSGCSTEGSTVPMLPHDDAHVGETVSGVRQRSRRYDGTSVDTLVPDTVVSCRTSLQLNKLWEDNQIVD